MSYPEIGKKSYTKACSGITSQQNRLGLKSIKQLAALAHESRLRTFKQLAAALDMPAAMLSFRLKELFQAELSLKNKQGRFIRYLANFQSMNQLIH